jgi:hypothetical protein
MEGGEKQKKKCQRTLPHKGNATYVVQLLELTACRLAPVLHDGTINENGKRNGGSENDAQGDSSAPWKTHGLAKSRNPPRKNDRINGRTKAAHSLWVEKTTGKHGR